MSSDSNYDFSRASGCSCGTYSQDYDYGSGCSCSSDYGCGCTPSYGCSSSCGSGVGYNPVSVTNSTCPNVDGGSGGQGGSACGNTSNFNVSMCNSPVGNNGNCCTEGVRKLLKFLSGCCVCSTTNSKDIGSICIYGDCIPEDLTTDTTCGSDALLGITGNDNVQNMSITNGLISADGSTVSLCAISVIRFQFSDASNQNPLIKSAFCFSSDCGCNLCGSCKCAADMANALYLSGLGKPRTITLQGTFFSNDNVKKATLVASLVTIDKNVAIFSVTSGSNTVYYGVPTCKIAMFK